MAGETTVRSLTDTIDALAAPFALEDLGSAQVPVLACDLGGADRVDIERIELATRVLRSLRVVTVGVVNEPLAGRGAELGAAFDILLAPPDATTAVAGTTTGEVTVATHDVETTLGAVVDGARANPQAAVAAAQLLRMEAYCDVPQGLVLESLTFSVLQAGPEFTAWLVQRGAKELPSDDESPILVERAGSSLRITFNRPRRANAFIAPMRDLLVEALRLAATEPTIEGVIIDGAGPSFCSGGDLAEFGTLPDPATGHATRLLRSPGWWMHQLARDIRVHLHGACIGAGIELPAYAGTVLAAPDTLIRLPEVSMGLVPGAGGTVSIPRRIGRQRTAWLAISGAEIDAELARSWGLVDRIER